MKGAEWKEGKKQGGKQLREKASKDKNKGEKASRVVKAID